MTTSHERGAHAVLDRILTTELTQPLNSLGARITWEPVAWFGDWMANHNLTSDRLLIFGLALVILMLVRPGGLFPSKRRVAELTGDDEGDDEGLYDVREEDAQLSGGRL